jgi:Sec-independent protein translocase protein TatA
LTSLFGLGAPEIAIIFLVTVFLLGPEKISEMIRQSGKVAGELKEEFKEVPAEFKKGLEEGETESRAKKARPIEPVKDDYEK